MWFVIRQLGMCGLCFLITRGMIRPATPVTFPMNIAGGAALAEAGTSAIEVDGIANDVRLASGQLIEQEFTSDSIHSYQIDLESGQYLRLSLEQMAIDVGVRLFRPGGHMLAEFGCRQDGPTPISLIAESSGTYRLELRALERDLVRGRYKLRVEEIRRVTARDRARLAAERAATDAEKLRTEWTTESNRKAIRKY